MMKFISIKKWKNFVKGIYDSLKEKYKFLITGSTRLNVYRKSGDSLQGRYHYYTLFPFTLAEVENVNNKIEPLTQLNFPIGNFHSSLISLFNYGGFPEPFSQDDKILRRWHNEKLERLFREDIRDVENIRDISSMKLLGYILPSKAASSLSINNLREDSEVSHRAVTNWLDILESFYYHFRIYPYNSKKVRAIKKEPKIYLNDWSEVYNEGQGLKI
ncbi:MAG: ATP-binding protein [Ignavibacteriaceae bacterium]|nr:ATP-binding protein [Ignavibacteriaceae bacterium]